MSLTEREAAALGLGKQARPAKPTAGGRYVVFVEGWHPTRVNQWAGRHWSVKHSLRSLDFGILWAAICPIVELRVPPAHGKRRVTLEIILGPRQRGGDPDSYWKLLLDCLKSLKWIKDDSRQWVELAPVVFTRGPKKATRITLEDLP